MPVRVKRAGLNNAPGTGTVEGGPEFVEVPWENRITVKDGIQVHWAPNEIKNFADDGVGVAHAAFTGGATIVVDNLPFAGRS